MIYLDNTTDTQEIFIPRKAVEPEYSPMNRPLEVFIDNVKVQDNVMTYLRTVEPQSKDEGYSTVTVSMNVPMTYQNLTDNGVFQFNEPVGTVEVDTSSYGEQMYNDGYQQGEFNGYDRGFTEGYERGKEEGGPSPTVITDLNQIPSDLTRIDSYTYDFSNYTSNYVDYANNSLFPNKDVLTYLEGDFFNKNNQAEMMCVGLSNLDYFRQTQPYTNYGKVAFSLSQTFSGCTQLKIVEGLDLVSIPNTTTGYRGYGVFENCSQLVYAPKFNMTIPFVETERMFYRCYALSSINNLAGLKHWSNVAMTDMFNTCINLEDISVLETWEVKDYAQVALNRAFFQCGKLSDFWPLEMWNIGTLNSIEEAFAYTAMERIPMIDHWNAERLTSLKGTFKNTKITDFQLNWNPTGMINMNKTFFACKNLMFVNIPWDMSKIEDMTDCFAHCTELSELRFGGDINPNANINSVFYNAKTGGNIYVPEAYKDNYAPLISQLPSGWTVNYE